MEGSLRSDGVPFGRPQVAGAEQADSLSVGFVGSGRAARSLARSLSRRGHRLLIVRRGDSSTRLASDLDGELVAAADALQEADVTILAVPDARVAQLAASLAAEAGPGQGRIVLHLAGSLGLAELAPLAAAGYATGAMHPLQVLSGWRIPPGTTFAVEAEPAARPVISGLVADLGGVELELPAGARVAYHAAAVIAANLGMTLLAEAVDLLEQQGVDRAEALQGLTGLVRGGLEASLDSGLPGALTGPVTRGDAATVAAHLRTLSSDPDLEAAYRAVSKLALRQARKDGRPAAGGEAVAQLLEESR
ncbi:MAG TPA: DUF2520 domain-containing protein [Candidatus Solibacter sp.]|jgi:predicted short-subunit dehydrogenase-like oxidoreductase (DUF2520 family)|nr:DUF2520 domain-containing protein [Candidatus Solibacter sp.]